MHSEEGPGTRAYLGWRPADEADKAVGYAPVDWPISRNRRGKLMQELLLHRKVLSEKMKMLRDSRKQMEPLRWDGDPGVVSEMAPGDPPFRLVAMLSGPDDDKAFIMPKSIGWHVFRNKASLFYNRTPLFYDTITHEHLPHVFSPHVSRRLWNAPDEPISFDGQMLPGDDMEWNR